MTWTYDATVRTDLNRTRETIGDTATADQQLADEILNELLTGYGAVMPASEEAIKLLMARYARLVSQTTGPISVQHSNRLAAYKMLLAEIRSGQFAAPWAGGISKADKLAREQDTDRVNTSFTRGMFDHPRNSSGYDR